MPETTMIALGWPLSEKAQSDIDDKKRKASREIRVDAMRDAVEFCQRTASRGHGKVVLVYPAEDMNHITASALLKTLEEPPGDARFVLASEASHQLLPTIRSRCLGHTLSWPSVSAATAWLQAQGLNADTAEALLRAAGGRPEDALMLAGEGLTPQSWAMLPRALLRGDPGALAAWSAARIIQTLQKLCHDLLAVTCAAPPRYFLPADLPAAPSGQALARWASRLSEAARTADHPYNPGLLLEALVSEAQIALNSRPVVRS
jgi:DNA polymerase-3 subunit delta'